MVLMLLFWTIAIVLWQSTGKIFYLYNFVFIGTALGVGIGTYELLPKKKKLWGRRLAQFLVGFYMLFFLGFYQRENMQIEGFLFYLMSGFFAGSVIHYLVAKIAGPLLFNRGWCGWACWTAMVLDLLPFKRNKEGRLSKKWEYLRYIHFIISVGLILVLWYGFNYPVERKSMIELYWLIGGNVLYYGIGIILAYTLQDNRAFCKYVCPIPVMQKITSSVSLFKIKGDADKCTNCGTCNKMCPMDISVSQYILDYKRVLSTECILCLECVNVCPKKTLDVSLGFDFGTRELLNRKKSI